MSWTRFAWLEKVEGQGLVVMEGKEEERKQALSVHVKMVNGLHLYRVPATSWYSKVLCKGLPFTANQARCFLAPFGAIQG